MVLQKTTSKMILHPIEKLLTQVKDTASSIFESVPDLGGPGEEEEDSSDDENNEDGTWKAANFKVQGREDGEDGEGMTREVEAKAAEGLRDVKSLSFIKRTTIFAPEST